MPVIALYNFDDPTTDVRDSAPESGLQHGLYWNGAASVGGEAVLDGVNDIVKLYANPAFQMDRGTLNLQFTLGDRPLDSTQTVLSRDSTGNTNGGYHVEILTDGSVVISHETPTGVETFGTEAGFAHPGDAINLTYSWDQGGGGGNLMIDNTTTSTSFEAPVPNTLTMNMGEISQPWMIGVSQAGSDPGVLNHLNQNFQGNIQQFSLSDTVDNLPSDGIVSGTQVDDLIDEAYLGDPDGDLIDNNDAVIPGDGPNDDRVVAGSGDDTVRSGLGSDTVDGGSGNDLIDTSDNTAPLPDLGFPGLYPADSDPSNDLDVVYGGSGNDTIMTGDDADYVEGGSGEDVIDGGIDADTLYGGSADDTIVGGEGSDMIGGGSGDDLIYGGLGPEFPDSVNIPDDAGDPVPNNGQDEIYGGSGNDTIYGLDDDDTIYGGTGNDLIDGGVDDDVVSGDVGNDTITGGQGMDTLSGGDDQDVFYGGNAGDVVDGGEGGAIDYDTLDLSGSGPLVINYASDNPENGTVDFLDMDGNVTGSMTFQNIENVIPCFTPGTMIATPKGEVAVELLKAGDRIITRDNGIQEIRWTGQKSLDWHDLNANPHMKPVLVRKGSLGNDLPERDMMVSPNHRLLVANDRTALYFEEHEVLVAAKHLVTTAGVQTVDSLGTTYIHFMFDRHEVVLSNGAWTESFHPGDYTLKGMGNAQRSEILELFPELTTVEGLEGYTAARRTLKRHEAILLAK